MEKFEGAAIGIDFGTTNSCVAVRGKNGAEVIANELGKRTTPSYVGFTDTGRIFGEAAVSQAAMNPMNTISDIKCFIGRRFSDPSEMFPFKIIEGPNDKAMIVVQYNGTEKRLAPELIFSMVLTKMKEIAEVYLETKVTNAVITVPAYFNDSQRQATKDAGFIAGLEKLQIINDSTAVAIAYGFDKMAGFSGTKNVLIFDLGSAYLDVSLITIKEGNIEVKAVAGTTHLGGNYFDNEMINHFVEEFKTKHRKDIVGNPRAMRKLRTSCEKAKRTLTPNAQTYIEIDSLYEDIDFQSTITREKFDKLNMDYFKTCINLVESCIRDAKMKKSDIHDVVLVGGSTRILMLQQMLQELFNRKELCKSINPDEAIACGAAIYAAALVGTSNDSLQKLQLSEVNTFTIRIENAGNPLASLLIPRNTPIPTKEIEFTTTQEKKQIKVLEGESDKVEENNLLGEFTLPGLHFTPKGPSGFSIKIDANGITSVIAQGMFSNGNSNHVLLANNQRLSEEEIKKMAGEAKNFELEDEKYKKMAIARNALEDYLYELQKIIEDEKSELTLSPEAKKKIEDAIIEETEWLENCDLSTEASVFEEKMKQLEKLLNPAIISPEEESDTNKPTFDKAKQPEDMSQSPNEATTTLIHENNTIGSSSNPGTPKRLHEIIGNFFMKNFGWGTRK